MTNASHTISEIIVSKWSLPLVAPFSVATRTAYEAQNVLVRIRTEDALCGYGAAAPVEYITGETQDSVIATISEVAGPLKGRSVDQLAPLIAMAAKHLSTAPSARAALEMSLYDLWAKYSNIPLWKYFGGSKKTLTTDMTIPIVDSREARTLVAASVADGFSIFKIKIGGATGHEEDLARIAAVAETAPTASLRIDANQAFAPDDAVKFIKAAQRISGNITLVEQPVAKEDFLGLKYVKDYSRLPIFADESARSFTDAARLITMEAVDGINVKLMKSGISEACDIIRLSKHCDIKLMVGCMLESPLGIAAAAAIAGGIGGIDFIDLDSHKLLKPVESLQGAFRTEGSLLELSSTCAGWGIDIVDAKPWNNDGKTSVRRLRRR